MKTNRPRAIDRFIDYFGEPARRRDRTAGDRTAPWTLVLAGGDGVSLRLLLRELFGDERPGRSVPVGGERARLRRTIDWTIRVR